MTTPKKGPSRTLFTPREDLLLAHLVSFYGPAKWDIIAMSMNGRTARQCRERYRSVLTPGIVNGPWSRAEDLLLTELYQVHGPKWSLIARHFEGRSDCNVKNRWARHLATMSGGCAETPTVVPDLGLSDPFSFAFEDPVDNSYLSSDSFINW
jgi:hypothetical protein